MLQEAPTALLNPPWMTAYDHDQYDEPQSDDDYTDTDPEAETDSGASDSEAARGEFVTDSDSDYVYSRPCGSDDGSNDDSNDGSNDDSNDDSKEDSKQDSKEDSHGESEDTASDAADEDWPATDVEQYNIEARELAEAGGHTVDSDDMDIDQPTSDPDTEDDAEQQLEAEQQSTPCSISSLPASFAGLCIRYLQSTAGNTVAESSGSRSVADSAAAAARVAAADAAALREIRHYQATVHNLISSNEFTRLVNEILPNYRSYTTVSDRAMRVLQVAAEDYLIRMFQDANMVAIAAGRQKIHPEDIATAVNIKCGLRKVKRVRRIVVEEECYCYE